MKEKYTREFSTRIHNNKIYNYSVMEIPSGRITTIQWKNLLFEHIGNNQFKLIPEKNTTNTVSHFTKRKYSIKYNNKIIDNTLWESPSGTISLSRWNDSSFSN